MDTEIVDSENETNWDKRLEILAEHADVARPRMFALYGLSRAGRDVVGWGLDFGEDVGAVLYQPYDAVYWQAASAESIHDRYRLLGEVHLRWLTNDE